MAETQRVSSYGRYPSCTNRSRLFRRNCTKIYRHRHEEQDCNFMTYDSSDDEMDQLDWENVIGNKYFRTSFNIVDYVKSRESNVREIRKFNREYSSRHVLSFNLLKEHLIRLGKVDKVLSSQWLDDRHVVFGTKCHKLMVYDVKTRNSIRVPLLQGQSREDEDDALFGIHSVRINATRTLLATVGKSSQEIAVYRLPSLDPVCVGGQAHGLPVYDMCWLDDEFLVSCSQDAKMALWRVDNTSNEANQLSTRFIQPVSAKSDKSMNQWLRSIVFDKANNEISVVSTAGYMHIWSAGNFKQKMSRKLCIGQTYRDICLAGNENGLYAVGCRPYTLLMDARTLQPIKKIQLRFGRNGVKSLSFHDWILTIGTGNGTLEFYDIKAQKYLESAVNPGQLVMLRRSRNSMPPDENRNVQISLENSPAILTHSYDQSCMRIFAAGGPFGADSYGSYVALWQ
ncbi:DDB1- and CUL4-associated factor 12-like isoform X2 [Nasonia vitripennis]|uniref:DDB1- and CUL4-associated factor 12 beta-propeller domain-containing protein n=1 Tax=Nasonia vitripennis TaxID=7425 RepID=A0A7M7IMG4_NASVI|nr:DDB1- and CUL4-associated factor 12-like isoform X2 [Nasonia vitripennis]